MAADPTNPHPHESHADFMGRCMGDPNMTSDYPDENQRLAVCFAFWQDAHKPKSDADGDKAGRSGQIHVKQTAAPPPNGDPLEYVMSDGSIDRMGDVIEQDGWMLDNFHKNPVALFSHDARFPIGKWRDVAVKDGRLTGRLDLMNPVSDRLREIHAAVAGGVLRAVSVGFHANRLEPLEGSKAGGLHFLETELVECSLVSVPANPNALAVAKALGISREGLQTIFGVPAEPDRVRPRRGLIGVSAGSKHFSRKLQPMNQLSERIQDAHADVVAMRDQLTDLIDSDDLTKQAELTERIEQAQNQLAVWERAEKALGGASEPIQLPALRSNGANPPPALRQKTWAQPKKPPDEKPGYLYLRHCVVQLLSHVQKKSADVVLQERYGSYGDEELQRTKGVHEWYTRAATAPANSTTAGWAAELAQVQYGEFFDVLMPGAIYTSLRTHGFRANLGRFATLQMPTRAQTPVVAGSFVGEGAPIPVRQAQTAAVSIGLKKMAVIVSYTREIAEHSTPQIEELLRTFISEDTEVAVDTVLIDANAATAIRPAGLRSGVAGLTPTAGGGFVALVGDIKQMIGVLAAANALRDPVWIMHPVQATSIGLTATANGVFPFKMEIDNRQLQGYPVIISSTMPLATVLLLDAADFVSISGDDARFEVSDQATLHFDDTTPLQIGTPGTPNTVAAPVRNMFQTDSLALRMILPMNWIMRRTGVLAWIAAVTW
jgi:HK97 family phage prohead protease